LHEDNSHAQKIIVLDYCDGLNTAVLYKSQLTCLNMCGVQEKMVAFYLPGGLMN